MAELFCWSMFVLFWLTCSVFCFFFDILSQNTEEKGDSDDSSDASKSEISLVYEIALKRNLCVNFEVRHLGQFS